MSYNVLDIANKILVKGASSEEGELISNLKLQKLLYYMQGFHLAVFNEPLFEEDLYAWQYGPVVPEIYHRFKGFNNSGIEPTQEAITLTGEREEELFNDVFSVYGDYSAIGLMNLTHQERPWRSAPQGGIIDKDEMKSFFKTRLE